MRLRDYQTQACDAIARDFQVVNSTLIVLPTGAGKSLVFSEMIKRMAGDGNGAIVIAHRQELLTQAKRTIEAHTGLECEFELGEQTASEIFPAPVLLASVQTMCSGRNGARRMHKFSPYNYGLVVCDEFHHFTAPMFRTVIDYFKTNPDIKILGVTATPDRMDEEALGQICESVAFDYPILQAIKDGWLVPVQQQLIDIQSLDFSHVRTTAGDLNGSDLAAVMESERNLYGICDAVIKEMGNRKAIMFCVSVKQAEMAADILNRYRPGIARWASGKTPTDERHSIMRGFSEGSFQILVNCNLVSEGFDVPDAELLIQARPTKSKLLYCLDEKTHILTPKGWRSVSDEFREAYQYHPGSDTISVSPVRGIVRRPLHPLESMYGIDGRHLSVCVTDNHRMLVGSYRNNRSKSTQVRWAFKLPKPGVFVPVCGDEASVGVPLTDNELSFIGFVMSDGGINPKNKQITLFQSERYPEIISFIESTLRKCKFRFGHSIENRPTKFGRRFPMHRWTISYGNPRLRADRHLRGWSEIQTYVDRDFAPALCGLSRSQLLVLLHAMNLGDGSKFKCPSVNWIPRTMTIASHNPIKSDRIQSLCVRRGIRCNLSTNRIQIDPTRRSVYLPTSGSDRTTWRKMDRVDRVWCVTVDSGFIICRRNGKVFVTGNCQQLGRIMRPLPGTVDDLESGNVTTLETGGGDVLLKSELIRSGVSAAPTFDPAARRRAAIAASPKSIATVMDFVGNAGRHKLIHSLDILGGEVSPRIRELAERELRRTGKPTPIDEMLRDAEEVERKERQRQESARRVRLTARATYTTRTISPFEAFDLCAPPTRSWNSEKTLSIKQRELLRKQSIDPDQMSYSQGKTILNELFRRWSNGLCSLKQAALLKKRGVDTRELTRDKASQLITEIATQEGWNR